MAFYGYFENKYYLVDKIAAVLFKTYKKQIKFDCL